MLIGPLKLTCNRITLWLCKQIPGTDCISFLLYDLHEELCPGTDWWTIHSLQGRTWKDVAFKRHPVTNIEINKRQTVRCCKGPYKLTKKPPMFGSSKYRTEFGRFIPQISSTIVQSVKMNDHCSSLTILRSQEDFLWWGICHAFQKFPTLPAFSQKLPYHQSSGGKQDFNNNSSLMFAHFRQLVIKPCLSRLFLRHSKGQRYA